MLAIRSTTRSRSLPNLWSTRSLGVVRSVSGHATTRRVAGSSSTTRGRVGGAGATWPPAATGPRPPGTGRGPRQLNPRSRRCRASSSSTLRVASTRPTSRDRLPVPDDQRDLPGPFRHRKAIEVRFADTDAMGHVNNAVYHTYVESARTSYLEAVTGQRMGLGVHGEMSFILAESRMVYRSPAH